MKIVDRVREKLADLLVFLFIDLVSPAFDHAPRLKPPFRRRLWRVLRRKSV